ncbi:MAG: hypothetical protein KA004_05145 [Verrucomicrobiales bacterium]|nr:hypothetical protein [Verrucomicrobiales bacterium]
MDRDTTAGCCSTRRISGLFSVETLVTFPGVSTVSDTWSPVVSSVTDKPGEVTRREVVVCLESVSSRWPSPRVVVVVLE